MTEILDNNGDQLSCAGAESPQVSCEVSGSGAFPSGEFVAWIHCAMGRKTRSSSADERLRKEFPLIRLPLLILHGTADRAAKPDGSRLFHELAGSADKTIRLYEGHVHDLLRDLDKERVLEDIAAWITERIPTVPRRSAPTGAPELWAGRQAGS